MTMVEASAIHSTFVVERNYPKSPERVFAAFADPVQKRRWYAESDSRDLQKFELDFRPGGVEITSGELNHKTPVAGMKMVTISTFHDIVPNRRIMQTQLMEMNGRLVSAALITFELLRTTAGTNLRCTHQGVFFDGAGGPQMREHGWNALLDRLGGAMAEA
jgi:uncharacterized protein YndB with AHSA1/START domain